METFIKEVTELISFQLTDSQISAFQTYEKELLEWNEKFNLTAINDSNEIRTKHFLDSLSCMIALREKMPKTMIDIGSGAGFPGIPLKIILPNIHVTLVDSIGKKTQFCNHIIKKLRLRNIHVIQSRAEELAQVSEHREQYDCALARAVANLRTLSEFLLPFVRVGGIMLAQKGQAGPTEIHQAGKSIHLLGGRLRQLHHLTLPRIVEDRYLVVIDKISATPPKYPRRTGIPSKTPLS